jgi:hypothetical protein
VIAVACRLWANASTELAAIEAGKRTCSWTLPVFGERLMPRGTVGQSREHVSSGIQC